jgi:hypothetical protein
MAKATRRALANTAPIAIINPTNFSPNKRRRKMRQYRPVSVPMTSRNQKQT